MRWEAALDAAHSVLSAIATKVDPWASIIGATIPTAPGIWAVAPGVIKAGVVAIPGYPMMPSWKAQFSRIRRFDHD